MVALTKGQNTYAIRSGTRTGNQGSTCFHMPEG